MDEMLTANQVAAAARSRSAWDKLNAEKIKIAARKVSTRKSNTELSFKSDAIVLEVLGKSNKPLTNLQICEITKRNITSLTACYLRLVRKKKIIKLSIVVGNYSNVKYAYVLPNTPFDKVIYKILT